MKKRELVDCDINVLFYDGIIPPQGFGRLSNRLSDRIFTFENNSILVVVGGPNDVKSYNIGLLGGTSKFDCTDKGDITIIRSMDATVYTFNVYSQTWKQYFDAFSLDGPIIRKHQEIIQQGESTNFWGDIFDFFDVEEQQRLEMEQFHKLIPNSMVLQKHNPKTYVDFAKIAYLSGMDEPVVLSAARDHNIVLSTMYTHKELLRIYNEAIAQCASYSPGNNSFYIACKKGLFVLDNNTNRHYNIPLPESFGRRIATNTKGDIIALENIDNIFFLIEYQGNGKFHILACEDYEAGIKNIRVLEDNVYLLTKEDLVYQYTL